MKATIEVGNKPKVFWLAALAMCEEHMGYYARENAFAANIKMFKAMVDAYNGGNPQALHYGAMAAVGGVSNAVSALISSELGGELRPAESWGAIDDIYSDEEPGFSFQVDPDMDGSLYAAWTTSNGNVLSIRLQGQWVWATAEGRRHGIPWRFLDNCGLSESDLLVIGQESESSTKPWCDGKGKPLWTPKGAARVFGKYPTELDGALEPYPDWGDAHQQAGWAADRVHAWSKLGGLLRACASVGADSSAIEERKTTYWPFKTERCIKWGAILRAMRK